jgi:hypothetical protein
MVRVIPKGTGIWENKPVLKVLTGLYGLLHLTCSIHGSRKPDAVPVDSGGLRKVVF